MTRASKTIAETVIMYRRMENLGSSMLREVKYQYADMAAGGDGGPLGFTPSDYSGPTPGPDGVSCRAYNYPEKPDSFFQEIIDLMGWV